MNYLDIVIGGLLLFGLVRGIIKGLFVELAALVAIIAGIYGAIRFSHYVGDYLHDKVNFSPQNMKLIAFAITFVAIIFGVSLLGKILTKLASFAALGFLNRILGGAFGGLKFAMIISAVMMFLGPLNDSLGIIDKETISSSLLYKPVQSIAPVLYPKIKQKYEEQKEDLTPGIQQQEQEQEQDRMLPSDTENNKQENPNQTPEFKEEMQHAA